jgi:drug/metabolite transporter (DMT)-like permease
MPRKSASTTRFTAALPIVGLGAAVILWGTSFVATKAALTGFGPLVVAAMRMLISSAVMIPLWSRVPTPDRRPGDWRLLAVVALFYPCLYYVFEGNALRLTTAGQAGTVSALVPLLVVVGARLFMSEHISGRAVVGLVASLLGVVVLSLASPGQTGAPDPVLGNALEVLAMVCYAVSMLTLKRLTSRYNPWFLTGLQFLVGALLFLPAVLLTPFEAWGRAPLDAWIGIVYMGLLVTILPAGLYNFALSRMAAGRTAMAINLVPVVALVTGWAMLGDNLAPLQLLACVVVFGGVVLGQMQSAAAGPSESTSEGDPAGFDGGVASSAPAS